MLAGWVIRGLSLPWAVIAAVSIGQRLTPDRLQGRVAAAISLLVFAPLPLTQALGASLLNVADYRIIYLSAAGKGGALLIPLVVGRTGREQP